MPTQAATNYRTIPPFIGDQADSDILEADNPELTNTEGRQAEALSRWTYLFLGCATLLPWNAMVNASPFFLSRLAGSPFHRVFNPYLSNVSMLITLVFQFLSMITSKQSSPSRRTFASVAGLILVLISLFLSTFFQGTPFIFLSFSLLSAAAGAVLAAYLCTAVFATASLLGPSFLQILISGQAVVAVVVSVLQVVGTAVCLWDSSRRPEAVAMQTGATRRDARDDAVGDTAARIFFGGCVIFLGVTLVSYTSLSKRAFYKSVTNVLEHHDEVGCVEELTGLVADEQSRKIIPVLDKSHIYRVFKQNLIFMFSLVCVFAVTLSVFPATTVRVQPVNPNIHPLLFTAVHFLVFNTGDLIGRSTCSLPCLVVWSAGKILFMSLLRMMFIPLILLCNIQRSATSIPIIHSDAFYMILLLAMGYSNGYVSARATLAVASLQHNPRLKGRREDIDVASTLSSFLIAIGLTVGALASFAVEAML